LSSTSLYDSSASIHDIYEVVLPSREYVITLNIFKVVLTVITVVFRSCLSKLKYYYDYVYIRLMYVLLILLGKTFKYLLLPYTDPASVDCSCYHQRLDRWIS